MKKLLAIILTLSMILSIGSVTAFASGEEEVTIPYSGDPTLVKSMVTAVVTANTKNVIVDSGFTTIGDGAFMNIDSMESVVLPNTVTIIENNAFGSCDNLKSVTLPNTIVSIGNSVFQANIALESITIPDSVTSLGVAFTGCTSLKSVILSNSITSLQSSFFSGCTSLESVTLPNSLESIGNTVFKNCSSLETITIPNTVTSIGTNAFQGCTSLATVNMEHSNASEITWTDTASYAFDIVWSGTSTPPEVNPGESQEGKVQMNIELPKATVKVQQDLFLTLGVDPETGEILSSGYKIKNLNQYPLVASVRSISLPEGSEYTLVAPDEKNWNELKKDDKFIALGILQDSEQDNAALSGGFSGTKWSTDITDDVLLGEIYAGGTVYFTFDMKYSQNRPSSTPLTAEMEVVIGLA